MLSSSAVVNDSHDFTTLAISRLHLMRVTRGFKLSECISAASFFNIPNIGAIGFGSCI